MSIKKTHKQFVEDARKVWGDDYSYPNKYIDAKTKIEVLCNIKNHGYFSITPNKLLDGHGCPKCKIVKLRKTIYGVGHNDLFFSHSLPSYRVWQSMIQRCYNEKSFIRHPTYANCSVCEEWLTFSNFKKWFGENYIEGYALDKDILVKGNKVYSPDTCCFVPSEINALLIKNNARRNNLPIGVYERNGKYQSEVCKRRTRVKLGRYDTPEEAFYAYKKAKEAYIKEVANEYYSDGRITKRVYDALMRYEVEITD